MGRCGADLLIATPSRAVYFALEMPFSVNEPNPAIRRLGEILLMGVFIGGDMRKFFTLPSHGFCPSERRRNSASTRTRSSFA
jgi:hypothetical protein